MAKNGKHKAKLIIIKRLIALNFAKAILKAPNRNKAKSRSPLSWSRLKKMLLKASIDVDEPAKKNNGPSVATCS